MKIEIEIQEEEEDLEEGTLGIQIAKVGKKEDLPIEDHEVEEEQKNLLVK